MRRWLFSGSAGPADPLLAADELEALTEATTQAAWVMNDELERAEAALAKGKSPFHKLAYGATLFWKGALSFDKELMATATSALNVAETDASEHHRMVTRDPTTGHQSAIYPPGAEYLLCQAQAQLLAAILGILKESWSESLAGINKLRKGYGTLQSLHEAEKKYLASHPPPAARTEEPSADDARSVKSSTGSSARAAPSAGMNIASGTSHVDFRTVTSDPVDLYIHSGTAMVWGIIKIALSITPPALKHLLALFSFRGDRLEGLQLLWDAADYKDNIFGAIGALVTLMYNNVGVALADIVPEGAVPRAKLRPLLQELRSMYPDSMLWLNEVAREAAGDRDLERALEALQLPPTCSFPPLLGMAAFERAIDLMFVHHFEDAAEAFLRCKELNSWNHATYLYNASACYIELYRDHETSDPEKAKTYADKAATLLEPVPVLARQKFMVGQQLPFDAFIAGKLDKWHARASSRGCSLAAAVGVSPVEELSYLWTGYRRMRPEELQVSIDRLNACEARPDWQAHETADERAALRVLRAIATRNMGQPTQAKEMIERDVLTITPAQIKACAHATDWALPVAHYELGVCLWDEGGREHASPEVLRQVRAAVEAAGNWGRFSLEDRLVSKLLAARATLSNLGV